MTNNTNKYPMLSQENPGRKENIISRGDSIWKMVNDMVTVCDAKGAAIIIQDVQNNEEYAWPSPEVAQKAFVELMNKPYGTISPKITTQASFLEAKRKNLIEEIAKIEAKNRETETKLHFHRLAQGQLSLEHLDLKKIRNLIKFTEKKMKELSEVMPYVPTMSNELENNEELTVEAMATLERMNMLDKVDDNEWFLGTIFGDTNEGFEGHSGNFTGENFGNDYGKEEEASDLDF